MVNPRFRGLADEPLRLLLRTAAAAVVAMASVLAAAPAGQRTDASAAIVLRAD
jgi:hypothetical protein